MMGVEWRCRVAINPDASLGRPNGLYGNSFSRASVEAIERATQAIVPPTITNLIAMEAPAFGNGRDTEQDIEFVLSTAFTAFTAARVESRRDRTKLPEVVVHTGFWGCGAYGGNRVLMALLQLLAAQLAASPVSCSTRETLPALGRTFRRVRACNGTWNKASHHALSRI